MKHGLAIVVLALGMAIGLVVPASGAAKVRTAEGGGVFTLNATCVAFGDPPCAFDEETGDLTITLSNPGTTTGTFKGTQLLTADFVLNVFTQTFEMDGTIVWNGRVKACGVGTIVYDVVASGFLDEFGTANFEVNLQTINPIGTTLPISGFLSLPGPAPTDPDTMMGAIDYTGEYICDHSKNG